MNCKDSTYPGNFYAVIFRIKGIIRINIRGISADFISVIPLARIAGHSDSCHSRDKSGINKLSLSIDDFSVIRSVYIRSYLCYPAVFDQQAAGRNVFSYNRDDRSILDQDHFTRNSLSGNS